VKEMTMGVALQTALNVVLQSAILTGCVLLGAIPNVEVVACNVTFVDVDVLPAPSVPEDARRPETTPSSDS
jgi:hypothetical protein